MWYKTARWIRLRKQILLRDKGQCQECKRYGRSREATTVHHIEPDRPELFWIRDNLISLCGECHNGMHDRRENVLTPTGEFWRNRRLRKIPPPNKF